MSSDRIPRNEVRNLLEPLIHIEMTWEEEEIVRRVEIPFQQNLMEIIGEDGNADHYLLDQPPATVVTWVDGVQVRREEIRLMEIIREHLLLDPPHSITELQLIVAIINRIRVTRPLPQLQPLYLDEEIDPDFNPDSETSRIIIDDDDLDGPEAKRLKHEHNSLEDGGNQKDDCAICLSPMELPVCFPCSHKYCLTCAKGLMRTPSKTCGICRIKIPVTFISNPETFATETVQAPIRKNSWFYKSRSGWWVYAPRMQTDIENAFRSGKSTFECIFNGQNCVLDFEKSIQTFGEPPARKSQKIKRGLSDSSHLGVAGLRYSIP